jgi:tetratricopeptide (TPR) repeat protein
VAGHYFISYSAADGREFAVYLYHALQAGAPSVPVWLDQDRLRLQVDRRWRSQIAEAIDTCAGLLFVASPDSVVEQSICESEWTRALERRKPVVVLRLFRDVQLPFGLEGMQEVDFSPAFDPATRTVDETRFRSPFSQLHRHFYWVRSAESKLRALNLRIGDARRALLRTTDPVQHARIERDVVELNEDLARQEPVARDPAAAARGAQQRIDRELDRERQQTRLVADDTHRRTDGPRFPYPAPFAPPTRFGNRELETRLVCTFLKDDAKRLLIVDGRGGLGKTALVCRVLEALKTGSLPDERGPLKVDGVVYLCPVGSHRVSAPDMFAGLKACLDADVTGRLEPLLHDPRVEPRARMLGLLEAAEETHMVVLLDNLESVVDSDTHTLRDGDAELDEALKALLDAPQHHVKVIVTTQIAPRDLQLVHPERQFVLSLTAGLPSPFAETILRDMDEDGTLAVRDAPDSLLTQARELTDGNPRALEALVGILRADRDRTLRDVLDDTATAPPENVTEVLVGDLFNRLDPPAQQVMQALAVYGHAVTANAVDYLLEPYVPGVDSAPMLKRLYNMRAARKEEGSSRYFLHSIDRAYALSRVPIRGTADREPEPQPPFARAALLRRGADYFRRLRKAREHWQAREDVTPQLIEFDLRCAAGEYEDAARILLEIDYDYLSLWGLNRLVAQMHERLQGRLSDARLRHDSASRLGKAYLLTGRYSDGALRFEEAIQLARDLGDRFGEASGLSAVGYCHFYLGEFERAIQEQDRALTIAAKLEGAARQAIALQANHVLAFSHSAVGETALALDHVTRALSVARDLEDKREESMQLGYLGLYASYLGKTAEALAYDHQALQLAQQIGARREEVFHWGMLTEAHAQRGEYTEAIRCANEALRLASEIDVPAAGSWNYQWLAVALSLTGDMAGARAAAEAGCGFDEPLNNQNPRALLGVIALRQGDESTAREALATAVRQADALLARCPKNWEALDAKALALCGLSVYEGEPRLGEAVTAFRAARAITRDAGTVRRAVLQLDLLAPADPDGRLAPARRAAAADGDAAREVT